MSSAQRAAMVPALAVAILVWNAMGYPVWMIVLASSIVLAVFFPNQTKGIVKFLCSRFKTNPRSKLRVIK